MPEKVDIEAPEGASVTYGEVTVQTVKPFTTLSALGIGYGTTNTAVGLLLVLGSTLPMGGSPLFFWGFLIMALGVAFIVGMNGANWSFSCLDVATHLAEEMLSPSTDIPKALIWTIIVGFSSGLLVVTSVLINVTSIDGSADNSALLLFYRITGSKAAAVGLWVPVLTTTAGAVWSIQTWQSRLAWTICREAGFPLHRHLSELAPALLHIPVWSLIWSASGTAIFGCLYLGSELAFNSLISTGLLLQYISYSIPVVLMLLQGRSNFQHGPFWYPRLGLVANIVMLSWTLVALVFYCFPYYLPVVADQMNYASVVLAGIAVTTGTLWLVYANKNYEVKEILEGRNYHDRYQTFY
ncbi:hypothetical protein CEP53_012919 [Fusarium sp. AF-6]|nr:hypothetical protein CEP53_012919 [Fusarium sp. AF-6]